jgi:hypothetical protein
MKKLGIFIPQLHPLDGTSLSPVNELLVEKLGKFVILNFPEVPFLNR